MDDNVKESPWTIIVTVDDNFRVTVDDNVKESLWTTMLKSRCGRQC